MPHTSWQILTKFQGVLELADFIKKVALHDELGQKLEDIKLISNDHINTIN